MENVQAIGYVRDSNFFLKLFRSKGFWILFWMIGFSYPIYRSMNRQLPPDLPVYFSMPEYSLKNEFNKNFGTKNLKGKFYIASFMFTSCPSSCPALMKKMQSIQKRVRGLGTKVALVTFTVDPENDTPGVLHKYARDLQSNPYIWNFLTGTKDELKKIILDGFKVPMGESEMREANVDGETISLFDIVHSEKFVLVDHKGDIRGYYSADRVSVDQMMIDLGLLVNKVYL